MPLTLPNGSSCKLCLLDTNALSEMVKYPTVEGRGYIERFPPDRYAPCFTVYNLFEIKRESQVFSAFLKFFRIFPSLLIKPFPLILQAEVEASGQVSVEDVLSRAFTLGGSDASHDFNAFIEQLFSDPVMQALEEDWRARDQDILDIWLQNKVNFSPTKSAANAHDAKRFVDDASIDTLCQLYPQYVQSVITQSDVPVLKLLPSMQMMLYSQYYRIFDPSWTADNQEATDVCISGAAPYVDAVVTENRQAEIYKKVQKHVNGMSLEITRLKDIRHQPG